jgi:hypothetical protein
VDLDELLADPSGSAAVYNALATMPVPIDIDTSLVLQQDEHAAVEIGALVPVLEHDRCALLHGDSSLVGTVLASNSIDALVTDPPAGIDFMGKGWDSDKGGRDLWIKWHTNVMRPSFDALKPGAHGLVWALPRTSHWTATALEDTGFEIRDVVMHLFGTGFPKSLTHKSAPIPPWSGTALKPACEHWIMVRKPLEGTYGENFAKYGTGVLNIREARIGTTGGGTTCPDFPEPCKGHANQTSQSGITYHNVDDEVKGRWPSHVVLSHSPHCIVDGEPECADDCPVRMLDEMSGKSGASRFYYVAKGARSEKDEGLDHLPIKSGGAATGRKDGSKGVGNPRAGAGRTGGARNFHPTVKGVDLMRYLVRLVTPPGGTVLDIFAGSGTTGVAALAEGCSFIGVELTAEYLPIIEGRLRHALANLPSDGNKAN